MVHATKDQAVSVLKKLTSVHATKDYYKKAEVGSGEFGYCVDLWVDRQKWEAAAPGPIPPLVDRVPVCVMLVG